VDEYKPLHEGRRVRVAESDAMHNLGTCLDHGLGVAAPDYLAAADWFRRAADAGSGEAAACLSNMYAHGRGGVSQVLPASSPEI